MKLERPFASRGSVKSHFSESSRSVSADLDPLAEVRYVVEVLEVVLLFEGQRAALSGGREGRSLRGELHIEVADVFFPSDGREERRREFPLKESLPVHTLRTGRHVSELMLLYKLTYIHFNPADMRAV